MAREQDFAPVERGQVIFVAMQALAAGHQFRARNSRSKESIMRARRVGVGIERPLDHWVTANEQKITAIFGHGPLA